MKSTKLLLLFVATILTGSLMAQTPQKFSYQAVVKNASNNLVINHAVGLRVSILNASNTVMYCETQTPVTNANGLLSVQVGAGTVVSGSITGIDWSASTYSIKSEIDPAGGTSYSITGTSALLSVPYALHAKSVDNAFSGSYADLTNKPTLATVSSTGSYTDLSNKPAIPSGTVTNVTGTSPISVATSTTTPAISLGTVPITNGGTGSTTAAGARTNLGATTLGSNMFTLTNPSAITFPQFNADNTVSALTAANFRTAIGAGTGGGTVTSVSGTLPISVATGTTTPAISLGTVGVANGGTGQTTYAVGDLLYASTTSALSKLADVATGNSLISGGAGVAPSWGKIELTTHVSGALPVANGGTGTATAPTQYGVVYASSTSAYASTAAGTAGQVLTSNGTSAPTWSSNISGTVTTATNLAGGSAGTIPYQSAAGTTGQLAAGTSGYILKSNGAAAPAWLSTLPVANGGTGTTTGSITGTGALAFAAGGTNENVTLTPSGTGNTLLNGNVGIGTTSPACKLDISSASGSGRQDMFRILAGSNSTGNGATVVLGSTQTHAGYISGLQTGSNTGDLTFGTNTSGSYAERMRIVGSTGNVGIGTTSPVSKLHIAGADMNIALLFENTSANPGRNYILFKTQGTEQGYIGLGGGATNHMSIAAYGASNNLFLETGSLVRMTILPSGNIGIGTTTPSSKLTVNDGNIGVQSAGVTKGYLWWDDGNSKFGVGPGSSNNSFMFNPSTSTVNFNGASCNGTTWANASDYRLKRDIQPMSKYGLSTVMRLKPVTYFYKADKTNHPEVGFIAQEVQKIVPEVVSGTEGDITKGETLGLSYGNLVPVLTKAIQEQQASIETLKTTVQSQQAQIDELKTMLKQALQK